MTTVNVKILPLENAPQTYAPYITENATHVIKHGRYWLDCGTYDELLSLVDSKKYWQLTN